MITYELVYNRWCGKQGWLTPEKVNILDQCLRLQYNRHYGNNKQTHIISYRSAQPFILYVCCYASTQTS